MSRRVKTLRDFGRTKWPALSPEQRLSLVNLERTEVVAALKQSHDDLYEALRLVNHHFLVIYSAVRAADPVFAADIAEAFSAARTALTAASVETEE